MSSIKKKDRLCIAYAAGPGDIVKTFSFWQKGMDDPNQVSVTYSALFFEACRNINARGIAISSCSRADINRTEDFHVENLPKGDAKNGLAFHLQQILYVRNVIRKAAAEGADMLVMADATGHFFPFTWFAPSGMQLAPTLHCKLWSPYKPISIVQKIINRLNRHIFSTRATAVLSASQQIDKQIVDITNNKCRPVYRFLPLYRRALFKLITPPEFSFERFNLLFAGRLETEKGVFDLLQIADELKKQGKNNISIHLCGNGSCETILRKSVKEKYLESNFVIHGFCNQNEMVNHINNCHAFIVPTKTTFVEGFNQVVAEAILSGRPVITSEVCPALEYVLDAVIEVL